MATIPEEFRETENFQIIPPPDQCHKALGMHWRTSTDTLHVATPTLEQKEAPKIASDVARTFDLMGWFSLCTVTLKILLQSLWKLQLGWDDEVPDHIARTWREWRDELPLITAHPIPRYNFDPGKKARSLQLHGFSDASDLVYAGVVYLRAVYEDATASLTLVIAKTRVAPLTISTTP